MTGDDENVAVNFLLARRCKPIGTSMLDQLDELELVRRQAAAKRLFLVRGIDSDRADGLLVGARARRPRGDQKRSETEQESRSGVPPTSFGHA